MNEKTLAELRTIFTGLVLVFSVVALLTINGTLAWFASQDEVSAEGMSVAIAEQSNAVKDVVFYKIESIGVTNGNNAYYFSPVAADSGELGQYSSLTSTRQLLIKIVLDDSVERVTLTANIPAEAYAVGDGVIVNKNSELPLSSVVEMQVLNDRSIAGNEANGYVVYDNDELGEPSRFVSFSGGNPVVSKSVELYATADGDDNAIFIFVDYYEESMEYIIAFVNDAILSRPSDYVPSADDLKIGDSFNFICDFTIYVDDAEK